MAILETLALTRRFGDLTAVDRLPIQVEARQIFGLLGSYGAAGGSSAFGIGVDFVVLAMSTIVFVIFAAWIYPRVVT